VQRSLFQLTIKYVGSWHERRKDFSRSGGETVDFSRGRQKELFKRGPTLVKFQFTNSKLREEHFSQKI